ncbi:MAG: heavy metal translocating P-type ATPase [bacterium]|nr:heavy metal translocating P-type ATPase [bacterium]
MTSSKQKLSIAAQPASAGTQQTIKRRLDLAVDGITCPACMTTIEQGIGNMPGIAEVILNYTTHRLTIEGRDSVPNLEAIIGKLDHLGYKGRPYELSTAGLAQARAEKHLLRAMAVAGFAAANIMMMSVAVWSGNSSGMEESTRDLFHWISAMIALPAVTYAGQPFFLSALSALKGRHLNMDVPISLAVILAVVMSLVQTISHQPDTYFDSAVMLLFFLLIGRYLDLRARNRTRELGQNLMALQKPTVTRIALDNTTQECPVSLIEPGDRILVPMGARIGVDGIISQGSSEIDTSLVTGESTPRTKTIDDKVYAGTLNLGAPLHVTANAAGDNTLLAEISALMDKAMQKRGTYVRLADKAASLYAPVVHLTALFTLIGWLLLSNGWQPSLLTAIAVLIITCPCALGLAVPVVQVVATGALFRRGILVNAGDALERLALIDTIVFDKTGTLTEPDPVILNLKDISENDLRDAARLARSSHHILARAIAPHAKHVPLIPDAREIAGSGVMGQLGDQQLRLGSHQFCLDDTNKQPPSSNPNEQRSELWFRRNEEQPVRFQFHQDLKEDAVETIRTLISLGFKVEILSGDKQGVVAKTAQSLGIETFRAQTKPKDKIEHIEKLKAAGAHVMMIGDGLNDAAALQTANVSVAPASALDITQGSADIVIVGNRLHPLLELITIARKARVLIIQNFYFAAIYNIVAIPLAVLGYVTPLLAALSMSVSSIIVTLNALRAQLIRKEQ